MIVGEDELVLCMTAIDSIPSVYHIWNWCLDDYSRWCWTLYQFFFQSITDLVGNGWSPPMETDCRARYWSIEGRGNKNLTIRHNFLGDDTEFWFAAIWRLETALPYPSVFPHGGFFSNAYPVGRWWGAWEKKPFDLEEKLVGWQWLTIWLTIWLVGNGWQFGWQWLTVWLTIWLVGNGWQFLLVGF